MFVFVLCMDVSMYSADKMVSEFLTWIAVLRMCFSMAWLTAVALWNFVMQNIFTYIWYACHRRCRTHAKHTYDLF